MLRSCILPSSLRPRRPYLLHHTAVRFSSGNAARSHISAELGWFPDCGVTKILASLPNYLGYYLALTGARLSGADL